MYSLSSEGPKCSTESSIPDQSQFINPIAGVETTKPAVKSWASIAATKGGQGQTLSIRREVPHGRQKATDMTRFGAIKIVRTQLL
jgi:hypothetical protein